MSSDQFSEKPLPPGRKRCSYCGEILKATDEACWLCQEKVGVQAGPPDVSPRQLSNLHRSRSSHGESAVLAVFGVLALLWIVGAAFETPGVLIVLLVLAVPAAVRSIIAAQRTDDGAERAPNYFLLFLNSLGVAALVGVAATIAFFGTCVVICFGGLALARDNRHSYDSLFACSIGGGVLVGLLVAGLLLYATRPRRG